jgi:hypothetical protein
MKRREIIAFKNYVLLVSGFVAATTTFAMSGPFDLPSIVFLLWIVSPYFYILLVTYLLNFDRADPGHEPGHFAPHARVHVDHIS